MMVLNGEEFSPLKFFDFCVTEILFCGRSESTAVDAWSFYSMRINTPKEHTNLKDGNDICLLPSPCRIISCSRFGLISVDSIYHKSDIVGSIHGILECSDKILQSLLSEVTIHNQRIEIFSFDIVSEIVVQLLLSFFDESSFVLLRSLLII